MTRERVWVEDNFIYGKIVGQEIHQGGWTKLGNLEDWMTTTDLENIESRIIDRSYSTAPKREGDEDDIIAQCGGCKWFASLNSDWGICCNEKSPQDGRIMFEHSGCKEHSEFEFLSKVEE